MDGWLTTKKRGTDDSQIEKDRIKALEARRGTKKGSSARPKAKAPPKKKASRRRESDEDSLDVEDDDDSLADFVVEDDEDESEDEVFSSSEDELILETETKSKPVASKRKRERKVQLDSDEDSSQDEGTFLESHKKRTSRPPQALRAGGAKKKPAGGAKKKPVAAVASKAKPKGKILQKKKNAGLVDLLSSDDDDDDIAPVRANKTKTSSTFSVDGFSSDDELPSASKLGRKAEPATKKTKTSSILNMDGFSSDDELPSASKLGRKSEPAALEQTSTSRFFGAATSKGASTSSNNSMKSPPASKRTAARKEDSDDDDDTPILPTAIRKREGNNKRRAIQDDDDDTPILPTAIRKREGNSKRRAIQDDDDDDSDSGAVVTKPVVTKPSSHQTSTAQDDFASDEEEAVALAWAMGESQKATAKKGNSVTDSTSSQQQEEEEDVVNMLEDSSDDDEDGGDEQDEYVDKDAKAAGSVLATANALSAQVLQTMMQWAAARSGSSEKDGGDVVPLGMIVDGALALSSMDEATSPASDDHNWISQELMRKICPNVTLANYQLIGVNWMALLHGMKCEVKGRKTHTNVNGILADEMGLGKTVQTIAFLSWLKHTNQNREPEAGDSRDKAVLLDDDEDDDDDSVAVINGSDNSDGPHLVIAPASVLSNWAREFENFAPHLNVIKYHGSQAERREQQEQLRPHLAGREASRRHLGVEPIDVILAPITYFQKEKSDDRSFLRKFNYDYLVVDEAHVLKNPSGIRYKSLDRFATKHRLLLTGTPVQNSPKELMSLLCFLMPLFSRKTAAFDDNDQNDGGASMLQHFVDLEGGKGYTDKTVFKKLKQLFAPFVLRRSKDDVLSQVLPPKERKVEFVELDRNGRNTYDSILAKHIKDKKNGKTVTEHLFTQLRKAANHPLMLRTRYKLPAEKEHLAHSFYRYGAFGGEGCTKLKVAEELEGFNDFNIHLTALELIHDNELRRPDLGRYVLDEEALFSSAKFVRLRKLLPELIADDHRILIFSVWTTCLDLLSCLLEQLGLDYLRMDGSTPVGDRQSLIDKYNGDKTIPIFLLSTKACGLGINLTAADTCIMHDLDFNPFNDLQAEDRCHRIGQKKPVTVYKLVSKETVDEDIYGMQQRKAMMNAAIMDNGSTAKEAPKEKAALLRTAVDRFLKSPKAKAPRPQTLVDEKENESNVTEGAIV